MELQLPHPSGLRQGPGREGLSPPRRPGWSNSVETLLSADEEQRIVSTFNAREAVEDFSVVVGFDAIAAKNCSLSAGQYFEVKIAYEKITPKQFAKKIEGFESRLEAMFAESRKLEKGIAKSLGGLLHAE